LTSISGQGSFALSLLIAEGRSLARKILLADDSVTAQNMGRKILADAGYEIVTVNNGSAALKRITEIKPDLIVLDVYMPGYSGLEVCQRLKDAPETAHIPVLLTVGKLEPFKPEEARRVRADGHIVKPFEASELLTAITRLEDRMVASQADGSRFATSVSGVERFGGEEIGRKNPGADDADTGWKSRLRFPSKKKKEEPEPEPEEIETAATFRDFRKTKGKSSPGLAFTVKEPAPPGQEPGLVPDIPRDITPEELDALSALAAKLDGPIPATENVVPAAEKIEKAKVAAIKSAAKTDVVKIDAVKSEVAKAEVETPAAATETTKPAEAAAPQAKTPEREQASKTELPVVEAATPASPSPAAESAAAEKHSSEPEFAETEEPVTPPVAQPVLVEAASLVEAPAPIDRTDEPMFDAAAKPAAQVAEASISAKEVEKKSAVVAAADTEKPATIEAAVSAEPVIAKDERAGPFAAQEEPQSAKIDSPAVVAETVSEAAVPEKIETPEEPVPSDEELAEALRLLTPSLSNADTIPSHGTLVAAGQLLAEEVARTSSHPRWVAEPMALSAEESALSLEAEMFQTFAVAPIGVSSGETEAVHMSGISAITAAVESRMATFDLAAKSAAAAEPEAEPAAEAAVPASSVIVRSPETTVAAMESSAADTPAPEISAAKSGEPISQDGATVAAERKSEPVELAPVAEAATSEMATTVPEEKQSEEFAGGTFADAVGTAIAAQSVEQPVELTDTTAPAVGAAKSAQGNEESSSEVEGEDMASKSGKSTWHQIRTGPAPTATGPDAVEAAKQAAGQAAEETPKAMAAAAAAEGSSSTPSSASATDASTIASIVDSVMADLRPKIVEEIAKKLAGK
jgi:CheY-like chemotaxis protein